jgi:hypothetical protein
MKNILKFSVLVLAAGLIVGLAGCSDSTKSDPGGGDDIFKENTSGRLLTTNLGAEDLVLFYDSVRSANLIGGLPANEDKFKMKLPDSNKMYVIYAVKYSDYNGKPSAEIPNLKVLDSALVYSDPVNETSCRIGDPKSGGTAEVKFTNQTNYYIEVMKGSAQDEDLFYVMLPNSTTSVFTTPETDGFTMYMTLNLPIKKSNKIIGVQRRFIDGWTRIIVPQTGQVSNITISSAEVTEMGANYHEGYLRIINNSGQGYRVRNGDTAISSTLGFSAIQNGGEQVWELLGEKDEPGRPYGVFNFEGGSATQNFTITPQFYIRSGYKYTLYLNPAAAQNKYNISEGSAIDPNTEEINW